MPWQKANPRPEIAPQPSQGLEPPDKSESNPNQLELHATGCPRQVRLQKESFQAVTALDTLFTGPKTTALVNPIAGLDDFELIAFLIVQTVDG
jgi:hypothetical protein